MISEGTRNTFYMGNYPIENLKLRSVGVINSQEVNEVSSVSPNKTTLFMETLHTRMPQVAQIVEYISLYLLRSFHYFLNCAAYIFPSLTQSSVSLDKKNISHASSNPSILQDQSVTEITQLVAERKGLNANQLIQIAKAVHQLQNSTIQGEPCLQMLAKDQDTAISKAALTLQSEYLEYTNQLKTFPEKYNLQTFYTRMAGAGDELLRNRLVSHIIREFNQKISQININDEKSIDELYKLHIDLHAAFDEVKFDQMKTQNKQKLKQIYINLQTLTTQVLTKTISSTHLTPEKLDERLSHLYQLFSNPHFALKNQSLEETFEVTLLPQELLESILTNYITENRLLATSHALSNILARVRVVTAYIPLKSIFIQKLALLSELRHLTRDTDAPNPLAQAPQLAQPTPIYQHSKEWAYILDSSLHQEHADFHLLDQFILQHGLALYALEYNDQSRCAQNRALISELKENSDGLSAIHKSIEQILCLRHRTLPGNPRITLAQANEQIKNIVTNAERLGSTAKILEPIVRILIDSFKTIQIQFPLSQEDQSIKEEFLAHCTTLTNISNVAFSGDLEIIMDTENDREYAQRLANQA